MLKTFLFVGISVFVLAGPVIEAQPAQQQRPATPPSVEDRTQGMKKLDGYFPLYWDERSGQMFLEISRFDTEFLYNTGLSAGLGSNDIGLDRGVSVDRTHPDVAELDPCIERREPRHDLRAINLLDAGGVLHGLDRPQVGEVAEELEQRGRMRAHRSILTETARGASSDR